MNNGSETSNPYVTWRRLIVLTAIGTFTVTAGCGGGATKEGPAAVSETSVATGTGPAAAAVDDQPSGGTFISGRATIVTPSKTFELTLSSGSFVGALGANGSISALWADNDLNDVGILGDGNGGYKISVGGDAAPNGITQNDCIATVTKDKASGVEGTFTCGGDITGTFEAR